MVTERHCLAIRLLVGITLCSSLFGCSLNLAPRMTEEDKQAFEDTKSPSPSATLYQDALQKMGAVINTTVDYRKIVQPKEIGNTAGGQEVPLNLTNMVINSISEFAGPRFVVAPSDPEFILNDFQTGGSGTRVLPDIVVGGSITEFDKDIEGDSSSIDLDILISNKGEDYDIGGNMGQGKKLSRVVLDLHLLDYKTHVVIPGAHVSNTIHVLELEKDHGLGFAMWGSGLGIEGRIDRRQGFHRAVRNLVEYSILQLFGKYYDLPYWKLLGMQYADHNVLQSLKITFAKKSRQQQIAEIQKWLNRYNLGPLTDPEDGTVTQRVPADGILDPVTKHYIAEFVERYEPGTSQTTLPEIYAKLIEHGAFLGTSPVRRPEDVAAARKDLSGQMGTTKDSTNLILMKH